MIWRFLRKKFRPAKSQRFFWEVRFSKKNSEKKKPVVSQKSKIQRGGQKALSSRGWGRFERGGVIKNQNSRGSTPPDTPLAHLCPTLVT